MNLNDFSLGIGKNVNSGYLIEGNKIQRDRKNRREREGGGTSELSKGKAQNIEFTTHIKNECNGLRKKINSFIHSFIDCVKE